MYLILIRLDYRISADKLVGLKGKVFSPVIYKLHLTKPHQQLWFSDLLNHKTFLAVSEILMSFSIFW